MALVAASAAVRFRAALSVPAPWITPDEQTYGLIARSLYESGKFEILGRDAGFLSLVYPALIGLPLSVLDPVAGYVSLKALQAVVMSLTAVPVYLWGRSLMSPRWALTAAALSVAVPGLAYSGFLMTEAAFYPILCVSAWAMARALARPSLANQAVLLATVVLAVLTRLQAIALVPILVLALLLGLAFDRGRAWSLRRFAPSFVGLCTLAVLWFAIAGGGGSRGRVLGSYQITGTTSYEAGAVARFALYHLSDLLLMTALFPLVALALLTVEAAAGRERVEDMRAFVAVVVAYTAGFVAQVGVFTSSLLGRLGERYLLGLSPLLFLSFALWLDRGAPRPRIPTALASLVALALVLALPIRFVSEAAGPDAFSMIPLYELRVHLPQPEGLKVALAAATLLLLAALVATPRRHIWLLPALAAALLLPASLEASRFVARQAGGFRNLTLGADERWIDRVASHPVAFVYGGEYGWSGGGPVWANLFWNRSIERVYTLGRARVVGPVPKRPVAVADDGRLLDGGSEVDVALAVASDAITFFGERVNRGAAFALWRLDPPARISTRLAGMRLATRDIDFGARIDVYDCRDGVLALRLIAPEGRTIDLRRDGIPYRSIELRGGVPWSGTIAPRSDARERCAFELVTRGGGLHAERFEFVRRG